MTWKPIWPNWAQALDSSVPASELSPPPLARPVSRPVVTDDTPEKAEYRTLAKALDFYPAGLEEPTIDQVLQRLGIEVFDRDAVQAFLSATCAKLGPTWRWEWARVGTYSSNWVAPYTSPIPIRVLRRMHALRAEVPSIMFSVSRITNQPKSDPFLLVTYDGVSRVIDCWDEPGFTG